VFFFRIEYADRSLTVDKFPVHNSQLPDYPVEEVTRKKSTKIRISSGAGLVSSTRKSLSIYSPTQERAGGRCALMGRSRPLRLNSTKHGGIDDGLGIWRPTWQWLALPPQSRAVTAITAATSLYPRHRRRATTALPADLELPAEHTSGRYERGIAKDGAQGARCAAGTVVTGGDGAGA